MSVRQREREREIYLLFCLFDAMWLLVLELSLVYSAVGMLLAFPDHIIYSSCLYGYVLKPTYLDGLLIIDNS